MYTLPFVQYHSTLQPRQGSKTHQILNYIILRISVAPSHTIFFDILAKNNRKKKKTFIFLQTSFSTSIKSVYISLYCIVLLVPINISLDVVIIPLSYNLLTPSLRRYLNLGLEECDTCFPFRVEHSTVPSSLHGDQLRVSVLISGFCKKYILRQGVGITPIYGDGNH